MYREDICISETILRTDADKVLSDLTSRKNKYIRLVYYNIYFKII